MAGRIRKKIKKWFKKTNRKLMRAARPGQSIKNKKKRKARHKEEKYEAEVADELQKVRDATDHVMSLKARQRRSLLGGRSGSTQSTILG